MPPLVDVAIDAGQTGVRMGLARAGRVLRVHEGSGLAYGDDRPAVSVLATLGPAWSAVTAAGTVGTVGTVCLGLTSVLGGDAAYAALAEQLLDRFEARRVLIAGDVVTAHAGALDLAPGVVLAAGTGAIALGVDARGRHRQVDGWGHLYGDAGGGFWIGRRGLDEAMRGFDGRGPAGPLTTRAELAFGELGDLAERLYPARDAVAQIAAFARDVLDLSATDPTARAIAEQAAAELASTVAAACGQPAQVTTVSWTGRLLRHEGLRRRFAAELAARCPGARLRDPAGDGLVGAARLAAATQLGPYQPLVRVTAR